MFSYRHAGSKIASTLIAAFLAAPALAQGVRAPPAAPAVSIRALTGWWTAIDDTFPKIWEQGVTPLEEVLIVNADGRFEDRTLNFHAGSAETCAKTRVCSDLPLIAYGRLRIAGNTLSIHERGAPPNRLDTQKTDPLIRRAAFSATSAWTIAVDGGLMTLQGAGGTRSFARVEPQRLRRLRAGMMGSGLPVRAHWRCFLRNASARIPAFGALREGGGSVLNVLTGPGQAVSPADFLDGYLRVASYLQTLDAMIRYPQVDDPASRQFIGNEPEQYMLEEFPDIKIPVSAADTARLKAKLAGIESRVRDKLKERSGGGPAPATPGKPVISDAEISAYAQAAGEEPAAKQLFCRE